MATNTVPDLTWSVRGAIRPEREVYVPSELLDRYVAVAMQAAIPRRLEGETWYADLPRFPGVWADGPSPKQCLDTLEEVLRDWLLLKIVDQDRDIPVVDEIDLNSL
jgi:predicted RNase H-like HicB family nuclease